MTNIYVNVALNKSNVFQTTQSNQISQRPCCNIIDKCPQLVVPHASFSASCSRDVGSICPIRCDHGTEFTFPSPMQRYSDKVAVCSKHGTWQKEEGFNCEESFECESKWYLYYYLEFLHILCITFRLLNNIVRLRITNEGWVSEMRIWSILIIQSDSKWCIHLSRSLFLNFIYLVSVTAGGPKNPREYMQPCYGGLMWTDTL